MTRVWRATALRSRVYLVVADAPAGGIACKGIHAHLRAELGTDYNDKHVGNAITSLKAEGYIAQQEWVLDGRTWHGKYIVSDDCKTPAIDGGSAASLLKFIEDFPAGVSEQVISAELRVEQPLIRERLKPFVLAGEVFPINIPPRHGGGLGWMRAGAAA